MDNDNTDSEIPTNSEEIVSTEETTETTETPTISDSEIAELKKKAGISENYRIRAEKAEGKLKTFTSKAEAKKESEDKNLSTKDTIALIEAKVSSKDFDEVVNWATYRKISVPEALNDKTLKVILQEKLEERETANATAIKTGNRGSSKNTDDDLLRKAKKGELPQTESEIDDLVEAEWALKMKK